MLRLNVIGDPVMHSKSPMVHGQVLTMLGEEYEYDRVLVKKGELETYIKNAVEGGVNGFNLTMPHKADIIPYLKEIDADARLFGAVNTVKINNGELYGYNTDAGGFVLALHENGVEPRGISVVILGAGGVSSTLALKLAALGAKSVTILNRTEKKAKAICDNINALRDKFNMTAKASFGSFDADTLQRNVKECDLLINATPLGMTGVEADYEDLGFLESLNGDAFVADLIYSPEKTSFLSRAEALGHSFMNGKGMLIGQAILADEIYLGRKLDVSAIYTKIAK